MRDNVPHGKDSRDIIPAIPHIKTGTAYTNPSPGFRFGPAFIQPGKKLNIPSSP
jgi:hypothetical protein